MLARTVSKCGILLTPLFLTWKRENLEIKYEDSEVTKMVSSVYGCLKVTRVSLLARAGRGGAN